jgi:hypothetical protein
MTLRPGKWALEGSGSLFGARRIAWIAQPVIKAPSCPRSPVANDRYGSWGLPVCVLGIVALGAALGGCASSSADITPANVSPVMYQAYTCPQLAQKAQAVSTRAASLSGVQDQKRTNDGLATAAAVVILWPAAFFVGGDKQTAAELAQMKGQMVAI